MGKSQKPLRILVSPTIFLWEEIQAYAEQGHTVHHADEHADYDVVLSENAWLMDESHRKYLPLALAEARRRRYPKEPREQSE